MDEPSKIRAAGACISSTSAIKPYKNLQSSTLTAPLFKRPPVPAPPGTLPAVNPFK
jgi:hypothetical protein